MEDTEAMEKKINIDGIVKLARQAVDEFRDSGAYPQENATFAPGRRLQTKYKPIVKDLFNELGLEEGYKIDQKQRIFDTLLANLLYHKLRKPVAISRNYNDWTLSDYNSITQFIIKAMDTLQENGYIKTWPGYRTPKESRMTRIAPTQKLLEYFPVDELTTWEPVSLIELHDLETGELIPYRDKMNTDIKKVVETLKQANRTNKDARIWHPEQGEISTGLIAIYKGSFSLYGRLHSRGPNHHQGLPTKERKKLLIDGLDVVELDYTGFNPYLLYAAEDRQYWQDPYGVVDPRPEARPFLKLLLLCMLNSEDFLQAERAANRIFYEPEDREERKLRAQLRAIGITRARPLMKTFEKVHSPIARHFYNGKRTGLRIMNKDAKIALDVVRHFVDKNLPILAIHDSFIVQHPYRDELEQTMRRTYKKHTGFRCRIKQEY